MIKGIVTYRSYANTIEFCMGGVQKKILTGTTCSSVEGVARTEGCSTVAVGDLGLSSAHWS